MKLSIFGLGYVGCVSAACLAKAGHTVIGVDINQLKLELINSGRSPIVESGVQELTAQAVREGRLRATADASEAIRESELSLVCVGTPGNHNGSPDLTFIKRVCQEIGRSLEAKSRHHIITFRSTMLPGTIEQVVLPALEVYSGRRAGRDFRIAVNPEFLREGTSISDFNNPPFTLIGVEDDDTAGILRRLYSHIDAPVITTGIREAEMVKYACNCFHALKVTFANEIGNVCKALGVDSHRVMDVFCQDTKLNLSPYYLKPGFAFGGSCLPKDLRALIHKARTVDVEVPVLSSVLTSNRQQVERAVEMVLRTGRKHVGVLGLSFKPGTDDLRESPMVTLIETLIGKGMKLAIFDREVELARLFGSNKSYIEGEIPHISSLMRSSLDEVIESSEVVVIGKRVDEYRGLADKLNNGRVIIDLVRMLEAPSVHDNYQGMAW